MDSVSLTAAWNRINNVADSRQWIHVPNGRLVFFNWSFVAILLCQVTKTTAEWAVEAALRKALKTHTIKMVTITTTMTESLKSVSGWGQRSGSWTTLPGWSSYLVSGQKVYL